MIAPRVEGSRVDLVPFGDSHLTEAYVEWLNDPVVVRFSKQRHRHHDLGSCRAYVDACRNGSVYLWAIEDKDDRAHIGNISARLDLPNRVCELAILFGDKQRWGCGLGKEAWQLALDFLLSEQGGQRVVFAGAMSANERMLRLMSVSGMIEYGRAPNLFLLDGMPVDMVMACRASEVNTLMPRPVQ